MNLLLDTHILLWWMDEPNRLAASVRETVVSADTTVFVSLVSFWEIAIKHGIGRLELDDPPSECIPYAVQENAFSLVPITGHHCFAAGALPPHHRDPFDRMLIAQAQIEDLAIITVDKAFEPYEVSLLQAVYKNIGEHAHAHHRH
ncbi:MAG: type II toxin-antitoxin system VapC family toxin [Proteobacteria bacterium]|nr:type II toxin-antitoxin system VapC family toxin [Pseudomonadota bacterium]